MGASKTAIAERFAALPPEKRGSFIDALRRRGLRFERLPIVACKRDAPGVCSTAQSRQWFLWQLDKESTAYHMPLGLRLSGALDEAALRSSFELLVDRHEALRTAFRASPEGTIEQVVQPACELKILMIDLSGVPADEREEKASAQASLLQGTPFDLTEGPLLRVALIRLSPEEHVLVVVMHHIVSDGWSLRIIVDEFVELYRAKVAGRKPDLKPLPIQYADYAVWQRVWLEAGEQERQLAYWREQLGKEHPVLQLPTDHPRQATRKFRVAHHSFDLPAFLTERLHRRAREYRATLFMLLLAGFQATLYRYTGQQDIRVGTTNANRNRPETQDVVGFFVNTQVLRSQVNGRMSLGSLLGQVREIVVGAQEHQDLPFEQLVEALNPERSSNHSPLFQIMVNHQGYDQRGSGQLPGLAVRHYGLGGQQAQFELILNTADHADGRASVSLTYAAELFEPESMERLGEHYVKVLSAIADDPRQRLNDVDLLSESERQGLERWEGSDQHGAALEHVHHLIERQAEKSPGATALIFSQTELSYEELNGRANQLAHQLISLGVEPERRVGIAVERSMEMVIGLLAILKAGGAYVPLDLDHPTERLGYMMRDSGVEVVLTQAAYAGRLSALAGIRCLQIDSAESRAMPATNPTVPVHRDSLAYAIYTSGSTGNPKGVAIRHGALGNFIQGMLDSIGLQSHDVLVAATPLSFDIAALELYLPLIAGARVVLATEEERRDGRALANLLRSSQATVMQATPAGWRLLLAGGWGGSRSGRLKALCGGEALQPDLAQQLLARDVELWNMYGPTETTIWSSAGKVKTSPPTLGRPITATQLRVLGADLQPGAKGILSELYIGGDGLARGYLNQPLLTAERFIADPFSKTGERLYRTGDLVRWNKEGELEYLGRIDHQVKVRGFRIELGEIEAQLLRQPDIREAIVVAKKKAGDARLVAYVVGETTNMEFDSAAIRMRLLQVLPEYMVPSAIVVLEKLPLNSNGKIDRKALPDPEDARAGNYEAPQGVFEEALAAIWSDVLGVERVGRHDNFFDLGGHSLLMAKVLARVREQTDLPGELKLADMMQRPTISGLIHRNFSRTLSDPLVRLNASGSSPALFCIHQAGGAIFSYFSLARALSGRRTLFGIACRSFIDFSHRDVSALQMAQDYAALIREQQPVGPYLLLGHSAGGLLASLIAHTLESCGCTVAFLGLVDTFVPAVEKPIQPDTLADFVDHLRRFVPHVALEHAFPVDVDLGPEESMRSNPSIISTVGRLVHENRERRSAPPGVSDADFGMSAEEIVEAFIIHQRMKRIALESPMLPALKVAPHCWWTSDRPALDRVRLERQIGPIAMERDIKADHPSIIDDPGFVEDCVQALAFAPGSAGVADCGGASLSGHTVHQNSVLTENSTVRGSLSTEF